MSDANLKNKSSQSNQSKANQVASPSKANPMWGGHFAKGPDQLMEKINESISFDKKLYEYDIMGSVAHATMLVSQEILTHDEGEIIITGLKQIKAEIEQGKFEFKIELEDIHMNIESRLKEIIGDLAGKLHTARSRNDQVATDFKLFVKDAFINIAENLQQLQLALINLGLENHDTIMPGFTHLQTAQPVTFGHHLHAYTQMFKRDLSRVSDAVERMNECPLGAAALAGTSFNINRKQTAEILGFNSPTANSIDSVSDRDFALDFLSTASIISMHLSRLAEEMVIWSSADFDFIKMSDAFTSGSSIMPQKRNPDAAELVRAKSGRIYGSLFTLLTVMKGLCLTYSKDMQEDKEPVFDAYQNLVLCIKATTGMILDIKINKEKMKKAAARGFSTATDIADWLVQNLNIPFRECHSISGKIVKIAEGKNCLLSELSLQEMQKIEPRINESIFNVLSVEDSVQSRTSLGGTAPARVKEALEKLKKLYD